MRKLDVGTELIFTIVDETGAAVNLSTATSVKLVMKLGSSRIVKDCQIVNATQGKVKYVVEPGVLSKSGILKMELQVTFPAAAFTSNTVDEVIEETL